MQLISYVVVHFVSVSLYSCFSYLTYKSRLYCTVLFAHLWLLYLNTFTQKQHNLQRQIQVIHKRMVRFQKLTRNLFLILHGHNLHRQQRQLSRFLVRYQQFVSHAYCGAAGPVFQSRARNSRCTVITDMDTSKQSTQKAFSCCDAILETDPAAPQ